MASAPEATAEAILFTRLGGNSGSPPLSRPVVVARGPLLALEGETLSYPVPASLSHPGLLCMGPRVGPNSGDEQMRMRQSPMSALWVMSGHGRRARDVRFDSVSGHSP